MKSSFKVKQQESQVDLEPERVQIRKRNSIPNPSQKSLDRVSMKSNKTENERLKAKSTIAEDVIFKKKELSSDMMHIIITEAFRMFDTDKSGAIDFKEFKKLVRSLVVDMPTRKIKELMRKIDKNGSGNIDEIEFRDMMLTNQFSKDAPISIHLENTFNLYDKDNDGFISHDDLLKVSMELQETLSYEEANTLINISKSISKKVGKDDRGMDREEFISLLTRVKFLLTVKDSTNANTKEEKKGDSGSVKTGGAVSSSASIIRPSFSSNLSNVSEEKSGMIEMERNEGVKSSNSKGHHSKKNSNNVNLISQTVDGKGAPLNSEVVKIASSDVDQEI